VSDRARGEIALQAARGDLMRAARLAVAGELVGGITHDLRQPLTALQLDLTVALHMLEREPPILHEAIAAINEASGERRRLTESLRVLEDLVKQREPHRVPVALGYVAGEAAQLLRSMASARHVEISLQVAAEVPRILADATLAREAVLGLVLEAVETAGRDDRRTTITIAVDQPNANYVELTVAYPGATDADSGRHWALSVARSVVEAHQGTLSTHTDPHGVTTIRTRWPTKSDRLDSPE
jgi:signal transduction histidine kinase